MSARRVCRTLTATACVVGMAIGVPAAASAAPGDLDPTFSGDGLTATAFGAKEATVNDVAIDAQGRIVAAGTTDRSGGDHTNIVLARFLPNGSLDPSFSGDGKAHTSLPTYESAKAVAIDSQGRIITAGGGGGGFFFTRYLPNGRPDPSFSGDGRVKVAGLGGASDVALDDQGRIVAVGSGFTLARLNPNGTLDKSFGSGGTTSIDPGATAGGGAASLAIDSRGRIVVGGWESTASAQPAVVARLRPNGRLDPTFSEDGVQTTAIRDWAEFHSIAIDPHNRVVAAGMSYATDDLAFAVARYRRDGSLDPSFSQDGKVVTPMPYHGGEAHAVAIDPEGRIVAAGYSYRDPEGGQLGFEMARYLPSGSLDPSFGDNGLVRTAVGRWSFLNALTVDPQGRLVVGGGPDFAVARYLGGP